MSVAAETNGGDVTSWIPLTTIFTPSSGCESIFRLNGPSLAAFDPGYGLDIDTSVKCAPSAVTTWWEQARLGVGGDGHTAVSIQPLTCPHLWTTVATYVDSTPKTQIMCCPSGYSVAHATAGPVNGDCVSGVSKGAVLTYASTAAGDSENWHIVTTTLAASSNVGAIAVVGYNVARASLVSTSRITGGSISSLPALQSSSSSPFTSRFPSLPESSSSSPPPTSIPTSASASASASASSSNPSIPSSSATFLPPPTSTPGQGQLSLSIKVGIGLGVSVGVIGIIALVVAIIMLRRHTKKKAIDNSMVEPPQVSNILGSSPYQDEAPKYERSSGLQIYEEPHSYVYELQSHIPAQELPPHTARSPVEIGFHDR